MNQTIPKRPFIKEWHVKGYIIFLLLNFALILSARITEVGQDFSSEQFFDLFVKMAHPDWSFLPSIITPLLQTVQMAIVGTVIGGLIAIPVALLAAKNIVRNPFVRFTVRFIMNLIRSIPEMLLAALFVAVVGIGVLSGVGALSVFSFGMMFKLLYEAIETIDQGPIEAMRAAGGNHTQIVVFAVIPQVLNQYLSFVLYTLEINVRSSAVLGYLGAGGIGLYLNTTLETFRYDRTAVVILGILVVVILVDVLSNKTREALS
ncbi:phosphonate ABC transporter, permease protein PhnE [Convivina intestini]|uniref:Phosphonate transport system permease protein n=1 Tax=Convivina intestini TaxID=1505726 RepID=A0A2U1DF13_9LACO|nr:phosphonate ABC transporter, permease protein PhnE [Convivina intestini]PVY86276.1 phosphonate transport system permease protein [Convivina intestini]CAH1851088.1 Phosphate-import permease protein PhnE [Convivina intestini]SDB82095.1 phosphonate transport system permease protein [Leuconostocaceae bacterium R-53105]